MVSVADEVELDLSTYEQQPKVQFEYSAEEATSLMSAISEHQLTFGEHIIRCSVVGIAPYFNVRCMQGIKRNREPRYIQGSVKMKTMNFSLEIIFLFGFNLFVTQILSN